jgi:hypothetical protein
MAASHWRERVFLHVQHQPSRQSARCEADNGLKQHLNRNLHIIPQIHINAERTVDARGGGVADSKKGIT